MAQRGKNIMLRKKRPQSVKVSPSKVILLAMFMIGIVLLVIHIVTMEAPNELEEELPNCGKVQIWSHRGHVDAELDPHNQPPCDRVLTQLNEADIRHFDIDVIFTDNEVLVAHPSEMSDTSKASIIPSPCSKFNLKDFIEKLQNVYGDNGFFITIEPKAAWKEEKETEFLSPPEHVIGGILNTLENINIQNQCGIILTEKQWNDSRIIGLQERIKQKCSMTTIPYTNQDFPLDVQKLPSSTNNNFKILFPSIEHFQGPPKPNEFLIKGSDELHLKNILWVIDTENDLRKALALSGVHGVVSNHPIQLKTSYEDLCHIRYEPLDTLI